MKKILVALAMSVAALTAVAEPSFDQMQELIAQKQYAAAESGLAVIIQNHPNSAKAFYSMAQAQAGLGHQDKAQFALNKAKGLDPTLKFATTGNVETLQAAITPQTAKIQKVDSGVSWIVVLLTTLAFGIVAYIVYLVFRKEKPEPVNFGGNFDRPSERNSTPTPTPPAPAPQTVTATDVPRSTYTPRSYNAPRSTPIADPVYVAPQPTVINNHYGSSNNGGSHDLVTGMVLGNMMSNSNHHDSYNRTTVIEREVIREVPVRETYTAPARDTSWDSAPAKSSSRSSSWDDDSSSSKSSSSSWDSGSSSSSSSSSWDSGSSSSSDSSSSSSSSSWD